MLALLLAGGGYARYAYNQNQPDRIWLPLKLPEKDLQPVSKKLEEALRKPAVLSAISKELNLAARFNVPNEEAAVAELSKRMYIEVGEAFPPSDRTPAINVGVSGKRKEHALLGEISQRLQKEVSALFGIKQPASGPF
ncbi:hypothetical protein KBB96_18095 [Luteolibacter ambystomatis]|uniref:Uncharacterized protein n=1 Tax=Luteolibacter ambystomatis TaxID=2824561 RepID=A0A975IZY2_9BACT|nr:hypothetical protein [Luteolibacter ambystomatis]QUE50760.1 hypothetical protein KBB96_18095 [Luteolibacter ambystomatis]